MFLTRVGFSPPNPRHSVPPPFPALTCCVPMGSSPSSRSPRTIHLSIYACHPCSRVHANLLCIVPVFTDDPFRDPQYIIAILLYQMAVVSRTGSRFIVPHTAGLITTTVYRCEPPPSWAVGCIIFRRETGRYRRPVAFSIIIAKTTVCSFSKVPK